MPRARITIVLLPPELLDEELELELLDDEELLLDEELLELEELLDDELELLLVETSSPAQRASPRTSAGNQREGGSAS